MGVINVTPDSFSDGGSFLDPGAAGAAAERLVAAGADVVDLGAESTRPGAVPVAEDEEWRRLAPVLERLGRMRLGAVISVDTRRPGIMVKAAGLGASMINEVGGALAAPADPAESAAKSMDTLRRLAGYPGMRYIAMHMQGEPQTMQQHPVAAPEAVAAVHAFFARARVTLAEAGFPDDAIWLDPGIGFGKTDGANVRLMGEIPAWRAGGYQVAIGVSRKGFIGRALGLPAPKDRDAPSKTLELGLAMLGAGMIRTHDVAGLRRLLELTAHD